MAAVVLTILSLVVYYYSVYDNEVAADMAWFII